MNSTELARCDAAETNSSIDQPRMLPHQTSSAGPVSSLPGFTAARPLSVSRNLLRSVACIVGLLLGEPLQAGADVSVLALLAARGWRGPVFRQTFVAVQEGCGLFDELRSL